MASLKTQGDVNIMLTAMQNGNMPLGTSMQSAGFMTMNKAQSQSGLFTGTSSRGYAARGEETSDSEYSSDESASDSEAESDAPKKRHTPRDMERDFQRSERPAVGGRIGGLDAHEAMENLE